MLFNNQIECEEILQKLNFNIKTNFTRNNDLFTFENVRTNYTFFSRLNA